MPVRQRHIVEMDGGLHIEAGVSRTSQNGGSLMLMVGRIVLSGAVLGMGMSVDLLGEVSLLRQIDCTGPMRRQDHHRSEDQRKQEHNRYGKSCRRSCTCIQGSFHALPDFVVVLSPLGG